jgi:5-methylcytosine-specific restriction enzyme A
MTLRSTLLDVASRAPAARTEPLAKHPFRAWMEHEAHKALASAAKTPTLVSQGSAGKGNWADICWLALMNPLSTLSAVRGLYVVYLFNSDLTAVYLCQGQGVTAVRAEFGRGYREELDRRCAVAVARVPEFHERFERRVGRLELNASTQLGKDYEIAPAYFKKYSLSALPEEDDLRSDLQACVHLYELLLFRGGVDTITDEENLETTFASGGAGKEDLILERRRTRVHQKVERASLKRVKEALGYTCQACNFDFRRTYGDWGADFIEAHHLTPLHSYKESEPIRLNPLTDFAVLCANCHRMVHRKRDQWLTIDELRALMVQ